MLIWTIGKVSVDVVLSPCLWAFTLPINGKTNYLLQAMLIYHTCNLSMYIFFAL